MSAGNLLEALTDNLVVDKTKCIFCGKCAETCILDNIRINRAPCSAACPLGLNIQGYVQLVARGKDDEARAVIAQDLPFATTPANMPATAARSTGRPSILTASSVISLPEKRCFRWSAPKRPAKRWP